MNIFRSNELGSQEIMVSPYDSKIDKIVKLEIISPLLNVSKCHRCDITWYYSVTWPLSHCKSTYRFATTYHMLALILKPIINSGTGSVYNYLSERKKGWNQILFYDRNKLKTSRKFFFNTVDSKFSYCAYFKCHVSK